MTDDDLERIADQLARLERRITILERAHPYVRDAVRAANEMERTIHSVEAIFARSPSEARLARAKGTNYVLDESDDS